jgi:hypothetical protein
MKSMQDWAKVARLAGSLASGEKLPDLLIIAVYQLVIDQ